MPDIIQRLKAAYISNPAEALDLISEVIQQYDEGLIRVLPCKVGDTVFIRKYSLSKKKNIIVEARCVAVKVFGVGFQVDSIPSAGMICKGEWGRQVFATRESAEKALESGT